MNILLTGAAGQLGVELLPRLAARGPVTATDRAAPAAAGGGHLMLDLSDGGELEALLNRLRPALIVNAAAYTAVDRAESETQEAFAVNADAPGRLARWAEKNDAGLVHYSTDYVFDGAAGRPYRETDEPGPLNVYGESKLAGERAIQARNCRHVILRTSWVYAAHGKNFVLSMLGLAASGKPLRVVNDQLGCPTWAGNLARASAAVIRAWQSPGDARPTGIFHYCDDRAMSWYDFARAIFARAASAGLIDERPDVTPVPDSEFPQPARRPKWSVLDTHRITEVFAVKPASFEAALQGVIDALASRR